MHVSDINHKLSVILATFVDHAFEGGLPFERGEAIYQDLIDHLQKADRRLRAAGTIDPSAALLATVCKITSLTPAEIAADQASGTENPND